MTSARPAPQQTSSTAARLRRPGAVVAMCGVVAWSCGCHECHVVLASDYDQSCVADSDCFAVDQVTSCPASVCMGCGPTAAINKSALASYQPTLSSSLASASGGECACPSGCDVAVCRNGTCQDGCSAPAADTLPACANAGGTCQLAEGGLSCPKSGPPDACAYSDEVCCVN